MSHDYNFAGGEILSKMGASWFVSYKYHNDLDPTHMNWDIVKTAPSRKSKFNKSTSYHKGWLHEIIGMNDANLNKNTIGLPAVDVRAMARKLI